MYEGQIFALLCHNGAGKTTTMSMLTGLLTKSEGNAHIFGTDMFGQMDSVRQMMGVCPQHDVLFDLLTPEEHLDIFFDFKGGNSENKRQELSELIRNIGISYQDKTKQATKLSGGNKRKLSVAIALCGQSRFVMLDEPTAGMDLNSRRALWDMLRNYRTGRIIVLTTHHMDEADVLGDRIGIMAKGKVICLGSSLFLKNRYGAGFKLTLVKRDKLTNVAIQTYLEQFFTRVEKLSEVAQEITFKIQADEVDKFREFFIEFDQCMTDLDILSYGISMTSLEEVFLRANRETNKETRETISNKQNVNETLMTSVITSKQSALVASQNDPLEEQIGQGTFCSQLVALIKKRLLIYSRDKCGLICEILIPTILVIVGLGLLQIGWLTDSPAYYLDTSAYPGPQRVLFNEVNVAPTKSQFTPQ